MPKMNYLSRRYPNISIFLTAALFVTTFVGTALAQSKTPSDLFNEVDGYVQARSKELMSQGKRLTRDQMDDLENEKRSLAVKYATELSTRTDLKKTDFFYLGMLYDRSDNGTKELYAMKKFLAEYSPDQKGDMIQIAAVTL